MKQQPKVMDGGAVSSGKRVPLPGCTTRPQRGVRKIRRASCLFECEEKWSKQN